MSRQALPTRRPSAAFATEWQGHPITVAVGYYPDTGQPGEVFADTAKGGQMQATLSDACVLISIALQSGVPPEALAKSLAREPDMRGGEQAASPVGAVVDVLLSATTEGG
jgi:hypothetical protein